MAFLSYTYAFFSLKDKCLISVSRKVATAKTLTDLRIRADCSKCLPFARLKSQGPEIVLPTMTTLIGLAVYAG